MDGEAIKIVIHDVDSGPICASKRRVILRRDPTDKAHRSKYQTICHQHKYAMNYTIEYIEYIGRHFTYTCTLFNVRN